MPDIPNLLREIRVTMGKFEMALGSVSEGIVWTDTRGNVQWCNASFDRLVGRPHIEILGADLSSLISLTQNNQPLPEKKHPVKRALSKDYAEPEQYEFEQKGTKAYLEITASRADFRKEVASMVFVFQDITKRKHLELMQEKIISDLQEALNKIKTLSGLLPICASCKNIRDDKGYWHAVEAYVRDRTHAEFTHGLCPNCIQKLYPGLKKKPKPKASK